MGKTVLLLIAAAVIGSTYIGVSLSETDIEAADSHRYVQAEQLAENVAMGGRTVVLSKMMAPGGGFIDSVSFRALVPDAAVAYNGNRDLGHYRVASYRVNTDGDTASFTVIGKHYKDLSTRADGSTKWEHATHLINATYTTYGIPPKVNPPTPREEWSCSVNDVNYDGGLDLSGDAHYGDEPRLVRITGGLNIPNNRRLDGTGILVIEGDLAVRGELVWDGIVYVYNEQNDMTIDVDQAQQVSITGAMVVGDDLNLMDLLEGINQNADGNALAGQLNAISGIDFEFDADADFTITSDNESIFHAARCVGEASYVLALESVVTEEGEDSVDDGHVCRNNNGHGNNQDGTDSSNPGQGGGGPNGEVDESCNGTGECVDDEIRP